MFKKIFLLFVLSGTAVQAMDNQNFLYRHKNEIGGAALIAASAYLMSDTLREKVNTKFRSAKKWVGKNLTKENAKKIAIGAAALAGTAFVGYKLFLAGYNPEIIEPGNGNLTCIVCTDDNTAKRFARLSCGHSTCLECLSGVVDDAIQAQRSTGPLTCPACVSNRKLTRSEVQVINPARVDQFNQVVQREAMRRNPRYKHCPTANCDHEYINNSDQPYQKQCPDCAKRYCGVCLDNHPAARVCPTAQRRQDEERATDAVAKPCPSCRKRIYRFDGCQHMTCASAEGGCGHQFCWVCLGNWTFGRCAPYQCNGIRPGPAAGAAANNGGGANWLVGAARLAGALIDGIAAVDRRRGF